MPHALSEREKEYLSFLQEYIRENENTPKLKEVAEHFGVTLPSAHKMLNALQNKGYIKFWRSSKAGYNIRLAERGGEIEKAIEIAIIGNIDEYGEIVDFPGEFGTFPVVLMGVDENRAFALKATQDIPQERIRAGDFLICDFDKRPQPGDIALLPFGKRSNRQFLCRIYSSTFGGSDFVVDSDSPSAVATYPMPGHLLDPTNDQRLTWAPIGLNTETEAYLMAELKIEDGPPGPIPPNLAFATVLRLYRHFISK